MRWLDRLRPAPVSNPEPPSSGLPYSQPNSSADTPWRLPPGSASQHQHTDSEENGYNIGAGGSSKTDRMKRETICGIRRKLFYMIIFGGVLVTVAAIAIGIGAGIAFGRNQNKPDLTDILSTTSDAITCPDDHDAVIRAGSTEQYFRLSCGIDYPAGSGAEDIEVRDARTMAECIDLCADRDGCLGVSWDNPSDDTDDEDDGEGRCALKRSVGNSIEVGDKMVAIHVRKPEKRGVAPSLTRRE